MMEKLEFQRYLTQLGAKVDDHFQQTLIRDGEQIACRRGCAKCCMQRFSIFSIEAEPIRTYLQQLSISKPKLRDRIRRQADSDEHQESCAFLVDGSCSIYTVRPMICRSHGLPISTGQDQYQQKGTLSYDCCPLNYRSEPPHPKSVLALDAINVPLVTIQKMWEQTESRDNSDLVERVDLAKLARA